MNNGHKKIIQTYTHIKKSDNNLYPPGFGDFISGAMYLYTEAIKRKFSLYIDYNNHIISNFLDNDNFLSSDPFDFYDCAGKGIPLEYLLENYNMVAVLTNIYPWEGIYFDDKLFDFIKNSFKPKKDLKDSVDQIKNDLNLDDYEVLHIRMGDIFLLHHTDSVSDEVIKSISEQISLDTKRDKKIFIASDCKYVKYKLKDKYENLSFIDNEPIHIGSKENFSLENTKNTLIDFFIMSGSKYIYSFSENGNSGWSLRCSQIYKIPMMKYRF